MIRGQKGRVIKRAWKALQSEAMVTGDEVLGRKRLHRFCLEGTTPQDLPQSSIPLIALVPIRATDPVAIYSIVFIRVHSCNSWAKKNSQ